MADWATISSLATAGGTLVLAVATFSAVRSSNRAARISERALQVGLRPVLFPSNPDDRPQTIRFGDDHWTTVSGGRAVVEPIDGVVYLVVSVRNVGAGMAVLHGWRVGPEERSGGVPHPDLDDFRSQTRDLYVPPSDVSFWQGAIREADDPMRPAAEDALVAGQSLTVDLLYGDNEGGQRTISRFSLSPPREGGRDWKCAVTRHWNIDRNDPR